MWLSTEAIVQPDQWQLRECLVNKEKSTSPPNTQEEAPLKTLNSRNRIKWVFTQFPARSTWNADPRPENARNPRSGRLIGWEVFRYPCLQTGYARACYLLAFVIWRQIFISAIFIKLKIPGILRWALGTVSCSFSLGVGSLLRLPLLQTSAPESETKL